VKAALALGLVTGVVMGTCFTEWLNVSLLVVAVVLQLTLIGIEHDRDHHSTERVS